MGVPSIGVVGSTDVAQVFHTLGFDVVSGGDFRDTATRVSERLRTEPDLPVVVCDREEPGLGPWTRKISGQTVVAVLGTTPGSQMLGDFPGRIELPATVNDLLPALGFQATSKPVGSHTILPSGDIEDGSESAPPAPVLRALPGEEADAEGVEHGEAGAGSPSSSFENRYPPTSPEPASGGMDDFDDLFDVRTNHAQPPEETSAEPTVVADTAPRHVAGPTRTLPPREEHPRHMPDQSDTGDEYAELFDITNGVSAAHDTPNETTTVTPADPQRQAENPPQRTLPETEPRSEPDDEEDDEFFSRRHTTTVADRHPALQARTGRTSAHGNGDVAFSLAGKGGVGKSTNALLMAWTAAAAGQTVVLIDANRGQADLRKFLRLPKKANLPTVYDAVHADPSEAILRPDEFAEFRRKAGLDVPDFGLVLGPPPDVAGEVTASVYGKVIDHARSIADLVVVDTQIVEAQGVLTDLWAELFVPLLREGAWQIGIADESRAGVDNLLDRLREFQNMGVPNAHTLIVASKYEQFDEEDAAYFRKSFGRFGTFIGATEFDASFADQMNMGRLLTDSPAVAPTTLQTLLHITGREDLYAPPPEDRPVRLPRFLRALFGGHQ